MLALAMGLTLLTSRSVFWDSSSVGLVSKKSPHPLIHASAKAQPPPQNIIFRSRNCIRFLSGLILVNIIMPFLGITHNWTTTTLIYTLPSGICQPHAAIIGFQVHLRPIICAVLTINPSCQLGPSKRPLFIAAKQIIHIILIAVGGWFFVFFLTPSP